MKKVLYAFFLIALLSASGVSFKSCFHQCENFTSHEVAATCTSSGRTYKRCVDCGVETELSYTQAFGHKLAVTKYGYEPTCSAQGMSDEVVCTVCSTVVKEQKTIAPLPHKPVVIDEGYAPTCNVEGKTETVVCLVCNAALNIVAPIPALSHTDLDRDAYCDFCNCHYSELAIPINTVKELKNIMTDMNGIYKLGADISLADSDWVPLGSANSPFTGYLLGGGHSISGLKVSNAAVGGIFSHNKGVIENVVISNISITAKNLNSSVGGLASYNGGVIRNCRITGSNSLNFSTYFEKVANDNMIDETRSYEGVFGGLVGINEGNIIDCFAEDVFTCTYNVTCRFELKTSFSYLPGADEIKLSSTFYFGLIAGQNKSEITGCAASATNSHTINVNADKVNRYGLAVANAYSYIGSITGLNTGKITLCNASKATATQNVEISKFEDGVFGDYGTKCSLAYNEDSVYKGMIGKNSGTVEGLVYCD